MQSPLKWIFSVVLCIFSTHHTIPVNCAPAEYDLDIEQAEARYDPRLLSQELLGSHSPPRQGAEECVSSDRRYEHGEKISRQDPCEVCICVDGEIFCWWKQCPTETTTTENTTSRLPQTKKPRKNPKFPPKKATNYPKKKILSFPQNLPVHLSELDLLNESDGTNITQTTPWRSSTTPLPPTTTPFMVVTQSSTDSSISTTQSGSINHARDPTEASVDPAPRGNVYFEKTIVNRNGVFIENIRKITDVVNRTLAPEPVEPDEEEHNQARKISLEDDALAKHYIITSSGRIENNPDSVLASESVVAQFRNNFGGQNLSTTTVEPLRSSTGAPVVDWEATTVTETTVESTTHNTATSTVSTVDYTTTQPTTQTSTEAPASRKCIVMGQSYEVGTVLPQETGNCLQCVCIAGATSEDAPRVTCSPHNCPPLILPDLFDTTGY
ncbi:uncharacterized protein LOC129793201 [Lutzomyia longipalpis]|uniref:uncharacterized protein LOC129793201 n=1 Tax=Lutzomyia longipalpis TaxID=7200 RepID=UPI0024845364|nr:uncharacterized protein LOC129793201 [Lutzomyia longipalpis]